MQCDHVCPISKMRSVLLATDGSEFSEGAIREAIKFASKCSSKLYAMSVIQTITDYEGFSSQKSIEDFFKTNTRNHLETVKSHALTQKVDCETFIANSDEPHRMIVDQALAKKVDMIVIGRRGRSGVAKLLMGEVAAKVIGNAHCKVLVVPRAAQVTFNNLLVATDGSEHGEAAVKEALGIAKCSGSPLIVLSAARDQGEIEEAQRHVDSVFERGQKEGIRVEAVTPVGRSFNTIVETAAGRGVDLIIMGTYGKTGLKKMLMGSSTEKVIGNAGCAVLVVKAE